MPTSSSPSSPLDRDDPSSGAATFKAEELLDAVGHAVIATDLDGVIQFWNRAAERLYGWTAEQAVGRLVTEVTVPQISQDMAADIMTSLRDGVPWSGGFPVSRRDGTVFHALVTDTVLYRRGEPAGMVGTSTDLGAALRMLLERSSDAALLLTTGGNMTYVSPAATTLFDWHPQDLLGRPFTDLVHPADRDRFMLEFESPDGRVLELRVRASGGWVWAETLVKNMLDDRLVHAVVCNLHYSERLIQLHEQERINERLHADVLQALFAVGLDLEIALHEIPQQHRSRVEAAKDEINAAITKLRTVTTSEL